MREIKFRGKSIKTNEWHYGNLIIDTWGDSNNKTIFGILSERTAPAFVEDWCPERVDENTISEFTGLYDKNGKEIYENDIVEWAGYTMKILWGEDCGVGYGFIWEPCGSNIDYVESMTGFIDEYEVIGNIFDNPELLGEQQ